jgi:hypothetical protein
VDPDHLAGLARPETAGEAEDWLAAAVAALGPRFDPDTGFGDYWLDEQLHERLESDLVHVRGLLGDRTRDLTYRAADDWLSELDPEYRVWARPVTQPPARLWLVERPDLADRSDTLDPSRGVAFEDGEGIWWIWEPATSRFHNDTPWLFTEFYFFGGARRGVFVQNDESTQRVRFIPLAPADARRLLHDREIGGAGAKFIAMRESDDVTPPDLEQALAAATDPAGWEPSDEPETLITRPNYLSEPADPHAAVTGNEQVEALRLGWPQEPIAATAGEPLKLTAELTNLGESTWRERDPGQHEARPSGAPLMVIAWLHTPDGVQLPAATSAGVNWSGVGGPVTIEPGKSVALPVAVMTEDVEHLPPGDYEIRATLGTLGLKADPATIRLLAQAAT